MLKDCVNICIFIQLYYNEVLLKHFIIENKKYCNFNNILKSLNSIVILVSMVQWSL